VIGEARLGTGESRTVVAYGNEPGLGVKTADCTRLYRWPHMSLNFPFEVYKDGYSITVQVQPDMRIYPLPYGTKTAMPAGSFERLQDHGFPLKPVQTRCSARAVRRI
jgi:hypothetical protein